MSTPTEWASGVELAWIRRGKLTRTRWRHGPGAQRWGQRWVWTGSKMIHPKWWKGNVGTKLFTYLVLLLFGFRFIKLLVSLFANCLLADHLEIFFSQAQFSITCLVLFNRALSLKIFNARYNLLIFHTVLFHVPKRLISWKCHCSESLITRILVRLGQESKTFMWDAEGRRWSQPSDSSVGVTRGMACFRYEARSWFPVVLLRLIHLEAPARRGN